MNEADLFFITSDVSESIYTNQSELYNPYDNWKLFILSGESNSIKSKIIFNTAKQMHKLGYNIELILNPRDVNLYDAMIIQDIKVSVVSEHSEDKFHLFFPGICEEIINIDSLSDCKIINQSSDMLKILYTRRGEYEKKFRNYSAVINIIENEIEYIIDKYINQEKTERYIKRFLSGVGSGSHGSVKKRMLSSLTADGIYVSYKSFFNKCDKIITLKDDYGVVSNIIIKAFAEYITDNNIEGIVFNSSDNPLNKFEHIIFSKQRIGFFTSNIIHPMIIKTSSLTNTNRFIDKTGLNDNRNKLKFLNRAKTELIEESINILKSAKENETAIDKIYSDTVKEESINNVQNELLNRIREHI